MNLVTEPWVPVVTPTGEHRLASLMEVFLEGRAFADLVVRTHERIALMRLLICVAQAALDGPEDIDAWDEAPRKLPNAAKAYLEEWKESFDLFHPEKPFLQIAWPIIGDDSGKSTPVSKLDCALATGNNSTLFDHAGMIGRNRNFFAASIALMLVTFQNYAQGGGVSASTWVDKPKNYADAPCKPSSMLHAFVRRNNLFDTIFANLLTKETVATHFNGTQQWGKPVWEMMPSNIVDKPSTANATQTYLGRLVPLSRLIRLDSQTGAMLLASGMEYPRFPEYPAETSATIVISRNGTERKLLGAGAKAIWRELSALVVSRKQGDVGGALTLSNVPESEAFDLWVGALLIDPKKTAEVLDTVESVLHIPAQMRIDAGRAAYQQEVEWAESMSWKLSRSVETYREEIDGGWEGRLKMAGPKKNDLRRQLHSKATRHYWTSVEKSRPLLIQHVEAIGTTAEAVEQTRSVWHKAAHRAACEAYRLACGQDTPRQIRAFALGWAKLFAKPKNDSGKSEHTETGTEAAEVD